MRFDPVIRDLSRFPPVAVPALRQVTFAWPTPVVADVGAAVRTALERCALPRITPGMRVAVGVGSRGIHRLPVIVRAAIEALRGGGAEPFIIPAMGSHGGATGEGQRAVLADLGVTEASAGCPILASMDTIALGDVEDVVARMDRHAYEADATVVINRVKPHTSFAGPIQSGLAKMCAIGLGKQPMAEAIHARGPAGLRGLIPPVARRIIERGRVLGGLAILENAAHQTAEIHGLTGDEIGGPPETALLARAQALLPRIPFERMDVLIVDEMGKNISGTGMDTNTIGRVFIPGVADPGHPQANVIVALDLTAETGGNANGIGLADIVTERLLAKVDWEAVRMNALTSGLLGLWRVKIPWVAVDDDQAIQLALRMCGRPDSLGARVARIRNTLSLSEMAISEALVPEALAAGARLS
jgi:hypothetical protein